LASQKIYVDPFNEVDVDVIFIRGGESWPVPAFWRGGSKRSVRFAPPVASEYIYHPEHTDHSNPDPNGHQNRVNLTAELVQAIQVLACGEPGVEDHLLGAMPGALFSVRDEAQHIETNIAFRDRRKSPTAGMST
jgi:hypothetical protein